MQLNQVIKIYLTGGNSWASTILKFAVVQIICFELSFDAIILKL
jgi:hypothetical protein